MLRKEINSMKRILLSIPELTYSGSAFSSLRIAKVLISEGYEVDVWSYCDGNFRDEYEKYHITTTVIDKRRIYNSNICIQLENYDLLIANTIIVYELADLAKNHIPTVWYIREAQNIPWGFIKYDYHMFFALKRAENIYAVSEYAADFISEKYGKRVTVVHNCVDDESEGRFECIQEKTKKVRFLALGTVEPRKAFDTVISAYNQMSDIDRIQSEIHFAGRYVDFAKDYYSAFCQEVEMCEGAFYHGEITDRRELLQLIKDCDVVVIPSKDESCSLVAIEGAMLSKPLILSTNIGARYLVEEGENGWIFCTDNIGELSECFHEAIDYKNSLIEMGKKSRVLYEGTSTYEIYRNNILKLVSENIEDKEEYRKRHIPAEAYDNNFRRWENKLDFGSCVFRSIPSYDEQFIIYGAGKLGKMFNEFCSELGCKPVCWVDKSVKTLSLFDGEIIIDSPDVIKQYFESIVYVAVFKKELYTEIYNELICNDVKPDRIKWIEPVLLKNLQ